MGILLVRRLYDQIVEASFMPQVSFPLFYIKWSRFILPDAIERAGTIETEAVIKALEETSIETSMARNFVFTSNHDVMFGENPNDPNADYRLAMVFQWQDGELVPVYPLKMMEEAGVTLMFPDWPGPWD